MTIPMRRYLILSGVLLLSTSLLLAFSGVVPASALPEYAAQTGEPCATCHVSPSGGGPRGPRGQAWVASGKPSTVPDTTASLELLGVELKSDPAFFSVVKAEIAAAEPLAVHPPRARAILRWLSEYDGN